MKEILHILDLLNDRIKVFEMSDEGGASSAGWRETRDAIQACRAKLTQGVSTT